MIFIKSIGLYQFLSKERRLKYRLKLCHPKFPGYVICLLTQKSRELSVSLIMAPPLIGWQECLIPGVENHLGNL